MSEIKYEIKATPNCQKHGHYALNKPKILNPKPNCIYHFQTKSLFHGEIQLRFQGKLKQVSKMSYFALSPFSYQIRGDNNEHHYFLLNDELLIAFESLPVSIGQLDRPPVIHYSPRCGLQVVTKAVIDVNEEDPYSEQPFVFEPVDFAAISELEVANKKLQKECQILAKSVPVTIGKHPLFSDQKRPSKEFLDKLYKRSLKFNNLTLIEQFKKTADLCTARAHFITQVLKLYGITSYKLFKSWNLDDWNKVKHYLQKPWLFHCSTMIIDAENNKWVWDPWPGLNQRLLSLNEWLFPTNEPIPTRLLIANSVIVWDYLQGKYNQTEAALADRKDWGKAFRYLFTTLPNPPEHPIFSNQEKKTAHRFFTMKKQTVLEAENANYQATL